MQLNTTSLYTIEAAIYMARHAGRPCSAVELEENLGIPSSYMYKATKMLKRAGIIRTVQGTYGGYMLMKAPHEITLYDMLLVTESSMDIAECIECEGSCTRQIEKCQLRKKLKDINMKLEMMLRGITIEDLAMDYVHSDDMSILAR